MGEVSIPDSPALLEVPPGCVCVPVAVVWGGDVATPSTGVAAAGAEVGGGWALIRVVTGVVEKLIVGEVALIGAWYAVGDV